MKTTPLKQTTTNYIYFTMFEVVAAMLILVIGIIGTVSLIPIATEMEKSTIGVSYAGDAAEQFLRYNASKIKVDWNWIYAFNQTKPIGVEDWGSNPVEVFTSENVTIYAASEFDADALSSDNIYSGMFRLEQRTEDKTQFAAVLRCWTTLSEIDRNAMLKVEISWPEGLPYEVRDKEIFTLAAFHPEPSKILTANNVCFSIVDNEVVPDIDVNATLTVLGTAMGSGGTPWPVTARFEFAATSVDPWGNFSDEIAGDINDGANPRSYDHTSVIPAGTPITIKGMAHSPSSSATWVADSSASGTKVVTLRDGDAVPDIEPFENQDDILEFVSDYVDEDGTIVVNDNQAIYLLELYTSNTTSPYYDLQDLVVLVTLTRPDGVTDICE